MFQIVIYETVVPNACTVCYYILLWKAYLLYYNLIFHFIFIVNFIYCRESSMLVNFSRHIRQCLIFVIVTFLPHWTIFHMFSFCQYIFHWYRMSYINTRGRKFECQRFLPKNQDENVFYKKTRRFGPSSILLCHMQICVCFWSRFVSTY